MSHSARVVLCVWLLVLPVIVGEPWVQCVQAARTGGPEDPQQTAAAESRRTILERNTDDETNIEISMRADRTRVAAGQPVVLTLETNKTCYLKVFHVAANGDVICLWPNKQSGWDNRVRSNTEIRIPDAESTFRISFDGATSTERIVAYATSRKDHILEEDSFRMLPNGLMKAFDGDAGDFRRAFSRGVKELPDNARWGSAQLNVRVRESDGEAEEGPSVRIIVEMRVPRGQKSAGILKSADSLVPSGFQLDREYLPVPMRPDSDTLARTLREESEEIVLVRGTADKNAIPDLKRRSGVVNVWRDPELHFFRDRPCPIPPCDCEPDKAKGTLREVASHLGATRLWDAGYKGQGIVIGIVDSGITADGRYQGAGNRVPGVVDGYPENWGTKTDPGQHGNMCATDALGMAPEAKVLDVRILDEKDRTQKAFESTAIAAYEWILKKFRETGKPQIVSNSWGLYGVGEDTKDYATNPNNCLTRKIEQAVNEGIIVLFAAGNCGQTCPAVQCGEFRGPGKSIWGPEGHPKVMTVGAVNLRGEWIGYSSQGPSSFSQRKPDFCAISHFKGFLPVDNGTSAACPVAAGIVALMKQVKPGLTADQAKKILSETAKDVGPAGWDQHTGHGLIGVHNFLERYGSTSR